MFVHAQQHLAKTGVQTHHIAFFHHHLVFGHDVHQHVVAHHRAGVAHMGVQVDHHRTALHTTLSHFFDAQGLGIRGGLAWHFDEIENASSLVVVRADDIGSCAKTVVVQGFGHTIAVGVEHRTCMGQAVPLCAVLQMHDDQVVAHDIGTQGVVAPHLVVHIRLAVAHCGS